MNSLNQWYRGMPKGQKLFVWGLSVILIPLYFVGLAPLAVLIYLELGARGN